MPTQTIIKYLKYEDWSNLLDLDKLGRYESINLLQVYSLTINNMN